MAQLDIPTDVELLFVQKPDVPGLAKIYDGYKEQLENFYKEYPDFLNSRPLEYEYLYHGTSQTITSRILKFGFDPHQGERTSSNYGRGCYFARYLSMSLDDQYSTPAIGSGYKYVFVAKVLVGATLAGNSSLHYPLPYLTSNNGENMDEQFNSAVDSLSDPSIFATFHINQAYPRYLLVLRLVQFF